MNFVHIPYILKDRSFLFSFATGLFLFAASIVAVFYSTGYANISASTSNSVTDIILSNTRVYDVDGLFVYGALAVIVFSVLIFLTLKVRHIPFALKSVSLFLFIRSIFVSLTHISPYPSHAIISQSFLSSYHLFQILFTGDDLFFSGHVGLSFLAALLFWDSPLLRYIYLAISVMFAVVVLLGHLHYSIDVFAAYFITYTIYVMAMHLFKKDYERTIG